MDPQEVLQPPVLAVSDTPPPEYLSPWRMFDTVRLGFAIPAVGSWVTVRVFSSARFALQMYVALGPFGVFRVRGLLSAETVALENLTGVPGEVVPLGVPIHASGPPTELPVEMLLMLGATAARVQAGQTAALTPPEPGALHVKLATVEFPYAFASAPVVSLGRQIVSVGSVGVHWLQLSAISCENITRTGFDLYGGTPYFPNEDDEAWDTASDGAVRYSWVAFGAGE